jgi:predicted MFS family arabinose efflux permease
MLSAFTFTFANGYLQGIASSQESNTSSLLKVIGLVLFFGGMAINIYSDRILQ